MAAPVVPRVDRGSWRDHAANAEIVAAKQIAARYATFPLEVGSARVWQHDVLR